jgi:hypothetical protein
VTEAEPVALNDIEAEPEADTDTVDDVLLTTTGSDELLDTLEETVADDDMLVVDDGLVISIEIFKGETVTVAEPVALIVIEAAPEADTDTADDVLLTTNGSDELLDTLEEIVADVDGLVDIDEFKGETSTVAEQLVLIEAEPEADTETIDDVL